MELTLPITEKGMNERKAVIFKEFFQLAVVQGEIEKERNERTMEYELEISAIKKKQARLMREWVEIEEALIHEERWASVTFDEDEDDVGI